MKTAGAFLGGAALGATVTYFSDPRLGKRRRALAKDAGIHLAMVLRRAADIGVRDSENRIRGIFEETKRLVKREVSDNPVLEDRVHTAINRFSSHPNVEVIADNGRVTLLGPVVDHEERGVVKAAKSVPGVLAVKNRMKPYKPADFMATQKIRPFGPPDIMQSHWAPATRIAAGGIGVAALVTGLGSSGIGWRLLRASGLALLVRAVTNTELQRLAGFKSGPRAADIQRTINSAAPGKRLHEEVRRAA